MSYDLASGSRACDHLNILERYVIDNFDYRTLHYAQNPSINMRAPINSASQLRLYFNDALVHPSDPVYGYSIVVDPDRVQEEGIPFQKILFNQPVRVLTPLIEISYYTRQTQCLKCGGTGNVADWVVAPNGSLHHITGKRKLAQQALKYILTSKNPFNPTLVCPIRTYVGRKMSMSVTDQDIATAVTQAMTTYQSIQKAQVTVQKMDPNEMIRDIASVTSMQDPTDPTKIYVSVGVIAYGSTETVSFNAALQSF